MPLLSPEGAGLQSGSRDRVQGMDSPREREDLPVHLLLVEFVQVEQVWVLRVPSLRHAAGERGGSWARRALAAAAMPASASIPETPAKCGASFPASTPVPQPTSTAARRRAGRLPRIQPWKCSL